MSNRSLAILAAAVVILGAFIWFFERHEPTTEVASQLAKKVFVKLTTEEVGGLEITNQYGSFAFARSNGGWRLIAPLDSAADGLAVDGVLSAVLGLEVDRMLGPGEVEASAYALDDPEMVVTLITHDDARHPVMVGGTTPLGGQRAISRGDRNIILTSGGFTANLDKGLDDWRARDLVKIRLADLVSIEIQTRGDTIEAIQVDDEWRLRSPMADLADTELLRNFVTAISSVRIEQFIDGEPDIEGLGLIQPGHHIVMAPADGGESTILDFGHTRTIDGTTQVVCRRNGTDHFWVNDRAETVLGKAPVRWREPKVRPFETWDITKIEIAVGGDSLALNRSSGAWAFEDETVADAATVQDTLTALAGLTAVDFDLMDLGTAEIGSVTVSQSGSEGAGVTFAFHAPLGDGGNVLVRVTGREALMSVRADDIEPILGAVNDLRPAPDANQNDSNTEDVSDE